jgi:2-keto-4-pentenoate hydratase/2-oxohepta-3-ene-1,7-dioic acid hydratase in catechol pathway
MKLLHFDDFRLGVLKGDAVVDVSAEVSDIPHAGPGDLLNGLIERWDGYKPRLEAAVARGPGAPVSSVRIRPPVTSPRTIDCMAVNYMEDGTRSAPAPLNAFHKSPSAIIGHGDRMVLPDVPASAFEGEAEIAVVIGRKCSHVSEAEAMSHVFGYMNFIDGSARGLGPPSNVFFQMKSRETFAPIGPYLVTADEIKDPLKLQIRLWNNGVLMQNFNTDDMGHNIAKCVAWLSTIHTLLPGDIVATGTNHRGLNPFMDGDTIELETEGLGRLKFGIKDDLKRTWARKTRLQMHEEAKEKTAGLYPDITPQLTGKYAK